MSDSRVFDRDGHRPFAHAKYTTADLSTTFFQQLFGEAGRAGDGGSFLALWFLLDCRAIPLLSIAAFVDLAVILQTRRSPAIEPRSSHRDGSSMPRTAKGDSRNY